MNSRIKILNQLKMNMKNKRLILKKKNFKTNLKNLEKRFQNQPHFLS